MRSDGDRAPSLQQAGRFGKRPSLVGMLRRHVRMRVLAGGGVRGLAPLLLGDERGRGRRVEHLQVLDVVIAHRGQRDIHIFQLIPALL